MPLRQGYGAQAASLLLLILLSGCTTPGRPRPVVPPTPSPSPVLAHGYVLSVTVMVAGEKEIDVRGVRIREDGNVDLPLLGSIAARDLTLRKFSDIIEKAYGERFFVNPHVTINFDLAAESDMYPWGFVTVLGRVKEPGRVRIPATRDLTVTQCIQKAGGFIQYARQNGIEIARRDPVTGKDKELKVDFGKIGSGEKDIPLKHGDIVNVPEVIF